MMESSRSKVFISYSHADRYWLDRLLIHLAPLTREFAVDVWSDTRIRYGSRWRAEIKAAIESCDAAILLISADFLASDFIQKEELPPLLQAADERGKLIVPVIVGPCLFKHRPDLEVFLAAPDPVRPLIMMRKGEAECVLRDVADRLRDRSVAIPPSTEPRERIERFLDHNTWVELVKIGNWVLDPRAAQILGSGMHAYLLSRDDYGPKPYHVEAALTLSPQPTTGRAAELGMNAGIVLGYIHERENPRYLHLSFTGEEVFLERVGFRGGIVIRDWEHISEHVPFVVQPGEQIRVQVSVADGTVEVDLQGSTAIAAEGVTGTQGRVGLRPWRSTMACTEFVVEDLVISQ